MYKTKKRNFTIDIVKCICAILVIFKHCNPLKEINENLWSYIYFNIAMLAVPIFFVFSGYFLEANEKPYNKHSYLKSIKRLLIPYTLWGFIYGSIYFVLRVVIHKTITIKQHIIERIINYFLVGTNYHLWYILSLIVCITIYYIIKRYKKDKLIYVITIIGFIAVVVTKGDILFKIDFKTGLFKMLEASSYLDTTKRTLFLGIPYFFLGNTIAKLIKKHNLKIDTKTTIISFVLYLILMIFVTPITYLSQVLIYVIVVIITIYACSSELVEYDECKKTISMFPNFAYYSHPLCLMVLNSINEHFNLGLGGTVMFIVAITILLVVTKFISKNNNIMKL